MDFPNRTQPQTTAPSAPGGQSPVNKKPSRGGDKGNWTNILTLVFVAAVVVVALALLALVTFGKGSGDDEAKLVDNNKLQAVFLNSGQVYFGNIKTANSKYFVLKNIYYLQTQTSGTSQANASTSVSLVKLGCELHEPYDQMVINRDQVTFWENLQDNGQVAKAVKTFEQQNPNGQKCSDQSSAASTSSATQTQNAGQATTNPAGSGAVQGAKQ